MQNNKCHNKFIISIFVFFTCVYVLTAGGHMYNVDGAAEYAVTKSLIDRFDVSVPEGLGVQGAHGKYYAAHGIGQALAFIPSYLLSKVFIRVFPILPKEDIEDFCGSMLNPIVTAATCALLFMLCLQFGYPTRIAVILTGTFGLSTITWLYAKDTFDMPLTSLLLLGSVYTAYLAKQTSWKWLVPGLITAFGLLVRLDFIKFFPVFLLYMYSVTPHKSHHKKRAVIYYMTPIAVALTLIAYYNTIRFGAFYNDGHTHDPNVRLNTIGGYIAGLLGLLLSPGKSVLLFSPIAIIALYAAPKFWRKFPLETILIYGCIFVNLLFYPLFKNWAGDWSWGPRFMVQITPLLIIPLGLLLQSPSGRLLKSLFATLVLLGFLVQVVGVSVDYQEQMGVMQEERIFEKRIWNPSCSQLIIQTKSLVRIAQGGSMYRRLLHSSEDIDISRRSWDFWWVYMPIFGVDQAIINVTLIGLLSTCSLSAFRILLGLTGRNTIMGKD